MYALPISANARRRAAEPVREEQKMASLLILKGTNPGQRLDLKDEKTVFGRSPDCQVVIASTAVRRGHAHIVRVRGKFFIEDLESRNKTFVNNKELAPRSQVELK